MKKILLIIVVFNLMLFMHSYGQYDKNASRVNQTIAVLLDKKEIFHQTRLFNSPASISTKGTGSYIHYIMDKNELQKTFNANYQSIRMPLPLPDGTTKNLLLTRHQILANDFRLTITDEKGLHEIKYEPGLYYIGIIEGSRSPSMVACTISGNELACVVSDKSGNWNLGALKSASNTLQGTGNEYVYYNDRTSRFPLKYSCGARESSAGSIKRSVQKSSNISVDKCVKIFFDCAYDIYHAAGDNATDVVNYVTALFNIEATLFFNENINVSLQSIHVWTVKDPFDYTDKDHAWQSFKNYYIDPANGGYPGDIAQLLSKQGGGGTAFIASMCKPPTIGVFSFSGAIEGSFNSFPTYSWDAEVITHEDGHVLGSHHTQWCGWVGGAIDGCVAPEGTCATGPAPTNGGTIMSYCHLTPFGINFANGFGPQPGNAIRNYVASLTCLTSCVCPSVVNIDFPIATGNNLSYSASGIVYGSSTINSGATVLFSAGNNVTLQPGFFAKAGSSFTARNAPCASFAFSPQSNSSFLKSVNNSVEDNVDVKVIPNPFTSNFVVSINSKQNVRARVIIYNSLGVKVKEQRGINLSKGPNKLSFNGANFLRGVYMLEINTGNVKAVKKIVRM